MLSLLDAGRIELAATGNPFAKSALVLRPASPIPASTLPADELPAHIVALGRALTDDGKGPRLTGSQVIHALQRAFGMGYRRYVTDQVAPSLIKRGLLERIDDKWLGLFARVRYVRTARGAAMAVPFERLMLAIEQLPAMIDRDPDQAIRLARSAGVLLIMSPKAWRQIPALRKLLAERDDDGASIAYVAIDFEHEGKLDQLLDIGDMALEFDFLSLFDSIEAVGDLTSSSDSSSDGGNGGGGGD
ncbi:MAG: hypothetical protein LH610_03330 [Sphingomonas bacterium]|nr:hypothetical protein [Sphingomonas bacterium]